MADEGDKGDDLVKRLRKVLRQLEGMNDDDLKDLFYPADGSLFGNRGLDDFMKEFSGLGDAYKPLFGEGFDTSFLEEMFNPESTQYEVKADHIYVGMILPEEVKRHDITVDFIKDSIDIMVDYERKDAQPDDLLKSVFVSRSFPLTDDANPDAALIDYDSGFLEITVPRGGQRALPAGDGTPAKPRKKETDPFNLDDLFGGGSEDDYL